MKPRKLYSDWYNYIKDMNKEQKRNPDKIYMYSKTFAAQKKKYKPKSKIKLTRRTQRLFRANNILFKKVLGYNESTNIAPQSIIKQCTVTVLINNIPCTIAVIQHNNITKAYTIGVLINHSVLLGNNNKYKYSTNYSASTKTFQKGSNPKHSDVEAMNNINILNLTEEEEFQLSTYMDINTYKKVKVLADNIQDTCNANKGITPVQLTIACNSIVLL